jgi:hypothetical protein
MMMSGDFGGVGKKFPEKSNEKTRKSPPNLRTFAKISTLLCGADVVLLKAVDGIP